MGITNRKGKKSKTGDLKSQVEPSHYFRKEYDSKGRFISYWYQISEVLSLEAGSILEVGIGNGFVTNYLKHRGINITTLDIDERLNPSVAGSVLKIPFKKTSFDIVVCYELLEHLPYDNFHNALSEIVRVSKCYAIISLPDITKTYRFYLELPKIGTIKKMVTLPQFRKRTHILGRYHYWEIGKADYTLKKIISDINKAGFNIEKTYRVFENPYHRFFILKK